MIAGKGRKDDAIRITTAGTNRAEERDARVRNYLVSMAIRVVCFGAAVVVGPGPLRWVLIAGAVLLPYVAVVLANAVDLRSDTMNLRRVNSTPQLSPPTATTPLTSRPLDEEN